MKEEAAACAQQTPEEFEVWPENKTAVEVFMALTTQWRLVPRMTGILYQGLDYRCAHSTLEMMGVDRPDWPDVFNGLQIMESAALSVLNQKDAW